MRNNSKKLVSAMIAFVILLLITCTCIAKEKAVPPETDSPFDVSSDSLEADKDKIIFIGRVDFVYGDIKMKADRIEIFYDSQVKGDRIKLVIATGNVRLNQEKREAYAGRMEFEKVAGIITMTENPQIKQDDNTVSGEVIMIYLNDDKVKIKGGVKAVINPKTIKE